MAQRSKTPIDRVREVAAALNQRGYVKIEGETVSVTESGRRVAALVKAAQEEVLNEILEGYREHPDVEALAAEISARLTSEDSGLVGAGHAGRRSKDGPAITLVNIALGPSSHVVQRAPDDMARER